MIHDTSSPSPMRCMAHHALSMFPTRSSSCDMSSAAPRAAQPSLCPNDGPSQSCEMSPWPSHMPNDVSASWTCPLAHQMLAEQPVSYPTPTPHRSDVSLCAVTHHYSATRPTTAHAPSMHYNMPDHRDTSLGPLNQGSPPWDTSLHPQHTSHVPDMSDTDPMASRPSGTASMLPSHSLPPVVCPHNCCMPPACTTVCPNPQAHPQSSWMLVRQPTTHPKLRLTPAAVHPIVVHPHTYSMHLMHQTTCPTLGHVPGNVAHQLGITQAAGSITIVRPPAVERFAPVTSLPWLGHMTAPSEPEEDVGEPAPTCSTSDAGQALPSHLTPLPLSSLAPVPSLTSWGMSYAPPGTLEMQSHVLQHFRVP